MMQRSFSVSRSDDSDGGQRSRLQGLHELDGANAGGGRFDEGREHKGVM
jgi:hypothetical protein